MMRRLRFPVCTAARITGGLVREHLRAPEAGPAEVVTTAVEATLEIDVVEGGTVRTYEVVGRPTSVRTRPASHDELRIVAAVRGALGV